MGSKNALIVCIGTVALVVLGLVMLASTSVWVESDDSKYGHLRGQAMWTMVGLVSACAVAFMDYRVLRKYAKHIYLFSAFLLILCYVPGIGKEINGESRWITLPGIRQFQPSEFGKFGMIIGLAAWLAHYQAESRSFMKGFLLPGVILTVPVLLIFFEKDMGTAAGLGATGFAILFIYGSRIRFLVPTAIIAVAAMYLVVKSNPNRWDRIMAYQDLEANKLGAGLQQYRSQLAFGNGGVDGLGLGNGAEKHGYLPYAHTDFIFAMVGEELGLYFTLGTVFCFVLITLYGIGIAANAKDVFGRTLAIGVTCAIVIPAMMNIGVATSLLPNTGLPLPFVSYGGSNLVFTLAAIGLLVSIHRRAVFKEEKIESIVDRNRTIKI